MLPWRFKFAALPLHSAERLCLSGGLFRNEGGSASARGAASRNRNEKKWPVRQSLTALCGGEAANL
jgi:hypothetical protein